jgi:hypothetical protein
MEPSALELVSPDAKVKQVELQKVTPQSTSVLSIDLYFNKTAKEESKLDLILRYSIGGDEYEQLLEHPAEFKSAMSGGFSLKDL